MGVHEVCLTTERLDDKDEDDDDDDNFPCFFAPLRFTFALDFVFFSKSELEDDDDEDDEEEDDLIFCSLLDLCCGGSMTFFFVYFSMSSNGSGWVPGGSGLGVLHFVSNFARNGPLDKVKSDDFLDVTLFFRFLLLFSSSSSDEESVHLGSSMQHFQSFKDRRRNRLSSFSHIFR